jgi:glucose/arabinose dehydrogenase
MRRSAVAIVGVVLALTGLTAVTLPGTAAAAPPPLTSTLVASIAAPTALAFLPNGVLLATNQAGKLYVVRNGTPNQVHDLGPRICTNSERGLLGIAVDPQFATNRFIYLYFTQRSANAADPCPGGSGNPATAPMATNHVARFRLEPNDTLSSEFTVIDRLPNYAGNHNGGDLGFAPDGTLYVSVGDGGCDLRGGGCAGANNAARDVDVAVGKILRVNTDGTIPSDNPFVGQSSTPCGDDGLADLGKHCPETWAWGFRNPFRMAFGPTGKLYVNDVGQGAWEEIDDVLKGADYGWNIREGHCSNPALDPNCNAPAPPGLTPPIHDYDRSAGCTAITGAAFVPNSAPWPGDYQGDYLFADYGCGKIFRLQQQGGVFTRDDLVTGLGARSAVHMEFGPDGALYFTSYAGGGAIHKIAVNTTPPSTTPPTTTPPTTTPPTTIPAAATYLSTLTPTKATNGLGPYEKDRHNGGKAANDGGVISVGTVKYTRGLGVYPRSTLAYNLGKQFKTFRAVFGVDDSCGNAGKVRIEVHRVTGTTDFAAASSGTLTGASSPFNVNVSVQNADKLVLHVIDVASNGTCARSDWADARLLR